MAQLIFKFAAMNAGKTLSIITTHYSYQQFDMNVLLIKPGRDEKGEKNIISRNGNQIPVDFLIDENDNICQKLSYSLVTNNIQCIFVDEAQFLTKKHIDELSDIVDYHNVDVICYGLRADFLGNLFPGSKRLFEIADIVEPLDLKARCRCGSIAIMNARILNGNFVFAGEQVAIDGKDYVSYQSLCRKCYKQEKHRSLSKVKKYDNKR